MRKQKTENALLENEKTEDQPLVRKRGRPYVTEEEREKRKKRQAEEKKRKAEERIEDAVAVGLPLNQKIRHNDLTAEKVVELAERAAKRVLKPDLRNNSNPDIERFLTDREKIKVILSQSLYWYNMPPVVTDDDVAERLNMFFGRIVETGEVPTMERLALALGVDTQTLLNWVQGVNNVTPIRVAMIKKARQILADMEAAAAQNGSIPQILYIFRSKNFYGMREVVETVTRQVDPMEGKSDQQIMDRYSQFVQPVADTDE